MGLNKEIKKKKLTLKNIISYVDNNNQIHMLTYIFRLQFVLISATISMYPKKKLVLLFPRNGKPSNLKCEIILFGFIFVLKNHLN